MHEDQRQHNINSGGPKRGHHPVAKILLNTAATALMHAASSGEPGKGWFCTFVHQQLPTRRRLESRLQTNRHSQKIRARRCLELPPISDASATAEP